MSRDEIVKEMKIDEVSLKLARAITSNDWSDKCLQRVYYGTANTSETNILESPRKHIDMKGLQA